MSRYQRQRYRNVFNNMMLEISKVGMLEERVRGNDPTLIELELKVGCFF